MELWTIQNEAVYERLLSEGVYTTDLSRILFLPTEEDPCENEFFAYQWMASKMDERLGARPDGVHFPIWAWYKQSCREDGKPDMRRSAHADRGEPIVRMKLEVPYDEVLLSDFDDWHFALNFGYLSKAERESEKFDARCRQLGIRRRDLGDTSVWAPGIDELRDAVVRSWDLMFDVFRERDESWSGTWHDSAIQATFWRLEPDQVKSVEYFIAR